MASSAVEQIKVTIVDVAEQPSLSPSSHHGAAQAGGWALQVHPRGGGPGEGTSRCQCQGDTLAAREDVARVRECPRAASQPQIQRQPLRDYKRTAKGVRALLTRRAVSGHFDAPSCSTQISGGSDAGGTQTDTRMDTCTHVCVLTHSFRHIQTHGADSDTHTNTQVTQMKTSLRNSLSHTHTQSLRHTPHRHTLIRTHIDTLTHTHTYIHSLRHTDPHTDTVTQTHTYIAQGHTPIHTGRHGDAVTFSQMHAFRHTS